MAPSSIWPISSWPLQQIVSTSLSEGQDILPEVKSELPKVQVASQQMDLLILGFVKTHPHSPSSLSGFLQTCTWKRLRLESVTSQLSTFRSIINAMNYLKALF